MDKNKIRGGFELFFLIGRGINAFAGERRAMLRSFLFPLALFPVNLFLLTLYPPRHLHEGFGMGAILGISTLQTVLSFAGFIGLTFFFARGVKRQQEVLRFFEAYNWTGLVAFFLLLPFTLMAISGAVERDQMDHGFIFISVYQAVVVACIANGSLRLNWQLAGFIGALSVICDQTAWSLMMQLFDIPYTWDY